jgi:hypothetical protein
LAHCALSKDVFEVDTPLASCYCSIYTSIRGLLSTQVSGNSMSLFAFVNLALKDLGQFPRTTFLMLYPDGSISNFLGFKKCVVWIFWTPKMCTLHLCSTNSNYK